MKSLKLKNILLSIMAMTISAVGIQSIAATATTTAAPTAPATEKTTEMKQSNATINLYANPQSNATILETIDVSQRLVPFYRQEGWIKVGDPKDGKVGWINKQEYQQAMNNAFHSAVQMIFVEVSKDSNGKPQIVVYKNGQKLTDQQAQAVYERMQKQQQSINQEINRYQQQVNHWMQREMDLMNNSILTLPPMPIMQPIVFIDQSSPVAQSNQQRDQSVQPQKKSN